MAVRNTAETTRPEWPTVVDADFTAPGDPGALSLDGSIAPLDADFATAEDFFTVRPPLHEFFVPELGRKVRIRIITGKEADAYRASIIEGKGQNMTLNQRGMRAKLVVLALAKADGSRMFEDKDWVQVMTWPSIILENIFDRARKINGLTERDTDEEKNG